jgi:hypothetical protein
MLMRIPGTWYHRPRFKQFLPQLSAAMLWASLMIACGDGGSQGAMGQAAFGGTCGPSDFSCLNSGIDAPVAVGASLPVDVQLQIQGSILPAVYLESSNPDILSTVGTTITGVKPGLVALLLNTNQGEVLDFIHVWTQQPDRLVLHQFTREGLDLGEMDSNFQLLPGEDIYLGVKLFFDYQPLLGNVPTTWTLEGTTLTLLQIGVEERKRLVARAVGQSKLTAAAMGLTAQINIEVLP